MGATADVPESLLLARRTLEEVDGVQVVQDWHRGSMGWRLRLNLTPGNLGDVYPLPATTPWYVVARSAYPSGLIDIVPDAVGGVTDTFPHQVPNIDLADLPYRGGKICVATDSENNLRSDRDAEPPAAEDRLAWHVLRALEWVRRASRGTLLADGEWFELPFYREANGLVAFREGPETMALWEGIPITVGYADVIELLPSPFSVVTAFRSLGHGVLLKPEWGNAVMGRERPRALWVRLPSVVSLPPYRAPRTFGELRAVAAGQGVDLDRMLHDGTADFHDQRDHLLLLGFPVPQRVGGPHRQLHWQAIALPRLERRVMNGFRPNALGYWMTSSRGTLANDASLVWTNSENWHPDQLAARGRLDRGLSEQRLVLIGAGALGSMIGELVVRAGITDITVIDHDVLAAGNLVRHTLSLTELGMYKAKALAERLNTLSPSVRAFSIEERFPGGEVDERVLSADLVIDTTGEHAVLETIAMIDWTAEPTFASFAISMHARRLFAYLAKSASFDVTGFDAAYQPFAEEERVRDEERPWEGVGCWHPVFPARADEVALMAAAAVGLLNDVWPVAPGSSTLHVFERDTVADQFAGLRKIAP
jgi:molybdopterin/thiamine biosynthesis adenylyltransferase